MYCNATDIDPGDIVWIANPTGSSGAATYGHWFVVLARPKILTKAAEFWLAGIATRSDRDFDPTRMVRLPHDAASKSGHPRTGLTAPSADALGQVPTPPAPRRRGRRTVTASELQAMLATFRSYWLARRAENERKRKP